MGFFDLRSASRVASTGGGLVDTVGTAFGVPDCLLNLTKDVLNILPSVILFLMGNDIEDGKDMADDSQKSVKQKLRLDLGIMEFDGETGQFTFISSSSKNKKDKNFLDTLSDMASYAEAAIQLGAGLYEAGVRVADYINDARDCIKSYSDFLKYKNGNAGAELGNLSDEDYEAYINQQYANEMKLYNEAQAFIDKANNQLKNIEDILSARSMDPSLEPKFTQEALNYLSGTNLVKNIPSAQPEQEKEIFRLVYGPPRSTYGQFILSNDGIYFDSQSSGILPALTYVDKKQKSIAKSDKWKFSQASNLGGKGDAFSTENLKLYVNTILDPNIIDEEFYLREFYDKDGFLQELINNKNKRIYDLSAQISELEGASAPEAVVYNYKQSLISENALHTEKINKRKKQIELAVKLPSVYGVYAPYGPGEVPLNDFSYLANSNIALDVQKQKAMAFSQVDIDSVVLPIKLETPVTVVKPHSRNSSVEHLLISELGDGAIIYDGSSVSSTDSVILQAENFITTDSIAAMYNFLDTTVEDPSSTIFSLRNSISLNPVRPLTTPSVFPVGENYAQLIADSQTTVFKSGLGIAYLNGITKHSNTTPAEVSGLGSFVKLPNVKIFNDLLYSNRGSTIDFWIHMPDLQQVSGYDSGNVSSLYRLVLANENTGSVGAQGIGDAAITNNYSDNVVRGLILGFTRDVRLTQNSAPTNGSNPVSSSVFFLAPTQSLNSSSVGFISRSKYDSNECLDEHVYHSMTQRVIDSSFSSCGQQFVHVAITFDPQRDEIKFYLDGTNVTTSSLSYVFGIPKYTMPKLPTFKRSNSFEYAASTLNSNAPEDLKYGPKLDRYFTPWIVGGGYTDGMYQYGNFMGGTYGGIKSGLNGYLGSLKFYSRVLGSPEIINNYEAHRGFFKNIDISDL